MDRKQFVLLNSRISDACGAFLPRPSLPRFLRYCRKNVWSCQQYPRGWTSRNVSDTWCGIKISASTRKQRVSFTNPYPTKKMFHLKTNRPDMLQFKESIIEVGTRESRSIGLRFTPQQFPGKSEILIFIDSEDKSEDIFSINAVFT